MTDTHTLVCSGSGLTEGLALVFDATTSRFLLADRSSDNRFAVDVGIWNGGLNTSPSKKIKIKAKKRNAAK